MVTETTPDVTRLARDEIRVSARTLAEEEVRHLVDLYYQIQNNRIEARNIVRAQGDEPSYVAEWVFDQMRVAEDVIRHALDDYTDGRVEGGAGRSRSSGSGPLSRRVCWPTSTSRRPRLSGTSGASLASIRR